MRSAPAWLPVGRSVLALLAVVAGAHAADLREVSGRVVDDAGRPVAGAVVDDFWRANGPNRDGDGKPYDLKIPAHVCAFWGHLGEMAPSSGRAATTGADGRFRIALSGSRHALMAMDTPRRRGGLAILPKGKEGDPVEIRIGPMVDLRGSLGGPIAGEHPGWTHVYLNLPDDPTRPLDSTRLVSCGSFEARFAMSLPPGSYVLHGYNEASDAYVTPDRSIELPVGASVVDLGVLPLSNARSHISSKIERSKTGGKWVDVTDRYGKPAPRWHLTDARGISNNARIEDFRGKWLLIYFWGLDCSPCLRTDLPALAKFYEEHAADRDRFDVVAVCIDDDGDLTSMAALDAKLKPIIEHVWGGKPLPFPIAVDASFRTMESFGISRLGPQLVGPDGTLMKGDESALAERLKGREDRPGGTGARRP